MQEILGLSRNGELFPASKYMDETTSQVVDVEEDVQRMMFDRVADIRQFVQAKQRDLQNDTIEIAYALLQLEHDKLYRYIKEKGGYGYSSFYRFCEDVFGFGKSTVKAMLRVAREFCDGEGRLKLEYGAFSFWQLDALESIQREYRARVTYDVSVRDIKLLKKFYENFTPKDGTTVQDDLKIIKEEEQAEKKRLAEKKSEMHFYPATTMTSVLPGQISVEETLKVDGQTSDHPDRASEIVEKALLSIDQHKRETILKAYRESGKTGLEKVIKDVCGTFGGSFDGISYDYSPSKGFSVKSLQDNSLDVTLSWVKVRDKIISLIERGVFLPYDYDVKSRRILTQAEMSALKGQTSDQVDDVVGTYEDERCLSTPESSGQGYSFEHIVKGLSAQLHLLVDSDKQWTTFAVRVKTALDLKDPMYLIEYKSLQEKRKENIRLLVKYNELEKKLQDFPVQSDAATGDGLNFTSEKQRKEFLTNFKDWGVWRSLPEVGKEYYRYDFVDGLSIIVEVSKTYFRYSTNKEPSEKVIYAVLDEEHKVFDGEGIGGITKAVEWMTKNRHRI